MLQCKLAPRLSGYIIPAPSLKSTEDADGNWRIYVSWHGFLAHCPPSLSHPDSSVVYAAVFNPINLKLTALYNPYPSPLFASFSFISLHFHSSPIAVHVLVLSMSAPSCLLHFAPLCREVAQLFSSAPGEELLYLRWAFEQVTRVSVRSTMTTNWKQWTDYKWTRKKWFVKLSRGHLFVSFSCFFFIEAMSFSPFIFKLKLRSCVFYWG